MHSGHLCVAVKDVIYGPIFHSRGNKFYTHIKVTLSKETPPQHQCFPHSLHQNRFCVLRFSLHVSLTEIAASLCFCHFDNYPLDESKSHSGLCHMGRGEDFDQ